MVAYIVISIVPIIVSSFFTDLINDKMQRKKYLKIVGFFLIVFLALRSYYIGSTDTRNYYSLYNYAQGCDNWDTFFSYKGAYLSGLTGFKNSEMGFQIFVYALSRILKDPQWIIIISSVIIVISILRCLFLNCKDLPFGTTIFICLGLMTFEMQGMRQALAMSICLFAYEYAKERKLLPFILLVLLAMQFHQTAIVFLVVYVVCGLKFNNKNVGILAMVSLVTSFFAGQLVEIANNYFGRSYYDVVESGGFIATAIYIIIIGISLLSVSKRDADTSYSSAFFVLLIAATAYIMRYFGAQAAERISFYFMFSQCIILPNTLIDGNIEGKNRFTIRAIAILLSITLFIYRLWGSNLIPYRFFWS